MTSIFTNWIGSNKLNVDTDQGPSDPARNRALSAGSSHMSPIDRAASMTPKAHFFNTQHDWAMTAARDHHCEASEATLNGRASEVENGHTKFPSLPSDVAVAGARTGSRPNSAMYGSELSHSGMVAASSTLGGVDSEAAWSATNSSDANKNSVPRRKKKLAPPELLVIVKPPPSKQVNPLSLQIQLVMPQQLQQRRDGSNRRSSMDSSIAPSEMLTAPSTELRRRDSIGSTRSAGSEVSTAGSATSNGAGRRVTPLYNLNYHNILSTTVSDAGTDQKVAKYVRKGIDLDGFGILEPAELVNGVNDLATLCKNATLDKGSSTLQASNSTNVSPRHETGSSGNVDGHSAFSAPNGVSGSASAPGVEPPTSFQAMTPEARGVEGNVGGKLLGRFKRFSLNVRPASSASTGVSPGKDSGSTDRSAPQSSLFGKLAPSDPGRAPGHHDVPQLTPGAGVADGKRTEGYYWTVRKWNRKAHDGVPANFAGRIPTQNPAANDTEGSNPVLNSVWKRFNLVNRMGGSEVHPPPSQIPIRFEWTRNSKKSLGRIKNEESQARPRASVSLNASNTSIDRQGGILEAAKSNASLHEPRLSTGELLRSTSRPSSFVSGAGRSSPRRSQDTSAAGSSAPHGDEDSGDESDPEDSETPWNCHLVLGPSTRIPLGTLSPAPHHPKLVGQLAVPFPLPDLSGTGLGPDGAGLTREELKDVIIVTCLHLIVRESFGGLARRRSHGSVDSGSNGVAASMANVNGWRLANVPKKK